MKQIDMLERIMYAVYESDTETLRDFLMLDDEVEDLDIDTFQDFAHEVWVAIDFRHIGMGLINEKGDIDTKFTGYDNDVDHV